MVPGTVPVSVAGTYQVARKNVQARMRVFLNIIMVFCSTRASACVVLGVL